MKKFMMDEIMEIEILKVIHHILVDLCCNPTNHNKYLATRVIELGKMIHELNQKKENKKVKISRDLFAELKAGYTEKNK